LRGKEKRSNERRKEKGGNAISEREEREKEEGKKERKKMARFESASVERVVTKGDLTKN
jgi:hypothetical protein